MKKINYSELEFESTLDLLRNLNLEEYEKETKNKNYIYESKKLRGEYKRIKVTKFKNTLIFENSLVGIKNIIEYIAFLEKAEKMGYEIKCLYLERESKNEDIINKLLVATRYITKTENEYLEKLDINSDNKLKLRQAIYFLKNYPDDYNKQTAASAAGLHRSYLYRHIKVVEKALKEC